MFGEGFSVLFHSPLAQTSHLPHQPRSHLSLLSNGLLVFCIQVLTGYLLDSKCKNPCRMAALSSGQVFFLVLIGDIEQSSCPVIYPADPSNVVLQPDKRNEVREKWKPRLYWLSNESLFNGAMGNSPASFCQMVFRNLVTVNDVGIQCFSLIHQQLILWYWGCMESTQTER